eukprot:symbB.v1.2.006717.t1/scaffold402.1/size211320/11
MELSTNSVRRDNPLTWQKHNWPGQDDNGIINSGGIGQSEFMWYVRTRPPVMQAFAHVWSVESEDLLVSFDGCCAFRPPSVDVRWRTRSGWFHTDQNGRTTGSDFACAQGLVSITDSDESTGGFAVKHAEIFQRWPLDRENDFFVVPRSDELLAAEASAKPELIELSAGDMVLWDSRLLHCNVPGFHPYDEMDLRTALEDVGLQDASPVLAELTSVADAVWMWATHEATLEDLFESWALPKSLHGPVSKQFELWAEQLAKDFKNSRATPPTSLTRLAAYVCATPRHRLSGDLGVVALRRRLVAALMGCTTSHWPEKSIVTDTRASKFKYIVENSSADHVVAALKEQLSQDAVDELEACSSRLIQRIQGDAQGDQDGALPMSLSDAETTEELVTWCRQIENLQERHRETLVSWVEEREENGPSLLLLTEEEWKESGLKPGPLKIVRARVRAEANPPSQQNMTSASKSPDAPHADAVPHARADDEATSPTSHQASPVEYSLEDPADLAKFMKTADICFVRAEYFWQLFDQNKVPPARRQELEDDDENVINIAGRCLSPLVSHEDVEKWASGKEEALLCSISHCWESMEHADPLGDQSRRVASATALYAAADGAQVWVFMDFLSIYQYEQTPEQRKSFELAMQNMHLMYSHESTMTLRLEHLTPPAKIAEALKDKSNTVKIWHKPAKEVKHVPISDLTWNNREYIRRGWCRTEVQWSSARSTVLSNQQIDSHLNSGKTNQFNGQVAEAPEQFRLRTRSEKIQFMRDSDRSIVLDLQKKVFLQKAEKCEHLVVENVDATQIAILADSIEHYKVLKGLTLKNFRCELPEAERLWKVLGKMEKLQEVWYMKPGDADSLRVMNEARESCKSQVSFEKGKNTVEKTPEWREKRRQPEPKIPWLLEQLQSGKTLEELDLREWKSDQIKAVLRALKRSTMVKHLRLPYAQLEFEKFQQLLRSATSVKSVYAEAPPDPDKRTDKRVTASAASRFAEKLSEQHQGRWSASVSPTRIGPEGPKAYCIKIERTK